MKSVQKNVGNIDHAASPISDESAQANQGWPEECEARSGHFRHQYLPRSNWEDPGYNCFGGR
ncbi:MAG: hypothetical protein KBG62_09805 [Propionivibrio sp.]|nr:hypothetical protein [Propionivibrio sp.]